MREFNKKYIEMTLQEERLWKAGEADFSLLTDGNLH